MTWLQQLEGCSELKAFLQHTQVCVIVSRPDGSILWANNAFEEWSGYDSSELVKLGWKQITVPGDELRKDSDRAEQWETYSPIYSIQKQYYRKNKTACWGTLTAMRFPPMGDISFCVCTWVPHEEVTNAALEAAMLAIGKAEKASKELYDSFTAYSQISTEQKFIMTAVQLAQKYPKIAWAIVVFGFALFGVNNALEILKTIHLVPPVVQVPTQP
jgi:PAS domain S-box-containing protein